ncbi:MAG TPA: hypothetical protein VFU36_11540 [Jatrophihabitans sp.]|nr:hypothetical protein [Jatrophihabitans sp.]
MPHIPTPIRAALGLAATAVAEARKLPETLPQLPMVAVSTAMQASLRVQQHIATYAARGDEVLSHLRGTSAEPPAWATFDDAPANSNSNGPRAAFDLADLESAEPADLEDTAADLEDTAGELEDTAGEPAGAGEREPGGAEPAHPTDTAPTRPSDTAVATSGEPSPDLDRAPAGSPDSDEITGGPAAGKTAPAKATKAAPAKAAPAKAPAKKAAQAPAKKAPAKKAAPRSEPLAEAASKADPSAGPNPSTMAAEILHAHQGESPDEQ